MASFKIIAVFQKFQKLIDFTSTILFPHHLPRIRDKKTDIKLGLLSFRSVF